jgi:hypothetical protein
MRPDFDSVRNHHESAVFAAVAALAGEYPAIGHDADRLADVACVALNRLPPRYIRHRADLSFYQSQEQRAEMALAVDAAVRHAFEFVQARELMGARA